MPSREFQSDFKGNAGRFRRYLKRFPILVFIKRKLINAATAKYRLFAGYIEQIVHCREIRTIRELPLYVPSSMGSRKDLAKLTLLTANQIFPFLGRLVAVSGRGRIMDIIEVESLCRDSTAIEAARELKRLLDEYGSDKSSAHNYHFIYGMVLSEPRAITALLEVGLGTNNLDMVSNMGSEGRPGASLRAFREFLPNALIYGADVDRRILFEEERIRTFFVDQTDLDSFSELDKEIGCSLDLIIDDGLHSPSANIAVLSYAVTKLKPGGWFVVEDIGRDALPVWHVAAALLPSEFEPLLVSTKSAYVFLVQRTR